MNFVYFAVTPSGFDLEATAWEWLRIFALCITVSGSLAFLLIGVAANFILCCHDNIDLEAATKRIVSSFVLACFCVATAVILWRAA